MNTVHTITKTQNALDNVRNELAQIVQQYDAAGAELGDALKRARLGESKAASEVAKASKRRATLEEERIRLQLEEAALVSAVADLEAEEVERLKAEALPKFEEVDAQVRELERQFAELMHTAAEVGQQLREIQQPWHQAIRDVVKSGGSVDAERSDNTPRRPVALLVSSTLDDPDAAIKRWLGPTYAQDARKRRAQGAGTPRFLTQEEIDRRIGKKGLGGQDHVLERITIKSSDLGSVA